MVVTRSGGEYQNEGRTSKRGNSCSQRRRERGQSPDNSGEIPTRSVNQVPITTIPLTLTPELSLHRGEHVVNLSTRRDRHTARTEAVLHERQERREVRRTSPLPRSDHIVVLTGEQLPLLVRNHHKTGRMEPLQGEENRKNTRRNSQGAYSKSSSQSTHREI